MRTKWKEELERTRILPTMVDIKKAYPNTSRAKLWRTLDRAGVPPHACRLLQNPHSCTQYTIRTNSGEASPFLMHRWGSRGLPQQLLCV